MDETLGHNILEFNDKIAKELRSSFAARSLLVLNLIGSPGAGKTALLERTLMDLREEFSMGVIEGDLQTDNDARRIAAVGARVFQINTGGGCHLDALMVRRAIEEFPLEGLDILFIENIGNLVCPVEFDCGQDGIAAVLSVTEGDDKPEKYPLLFHLAAVLVLNKIDLLPYVDFSLERAERFARKLNGDLNVLPLSCRSGDGLDAWYAYLRKARQAKLAGS
ncbi:MAG: hydrogenase nickel incorporation protein HypB [Desulfovibrio sp.]|jgi:hydrogenase nickel incorporation protein HypB|nr:hydrogenase nickel incorporation protein HypB [Desulfovibrio sp.]